jgi:hypothetical protein
MLIMNDCHDMIFGMRNLIGYMLFVSFVMQHRLLSKYTTLWLKKFLPQSHPFLCHLTPDHLFTFTVSHPICPATHTDSTYLSLTLCIRLNVVQIKQRINGL